MKITRTGQFKKDYKRIVKQGKEVERLREIITILSQNIVLPAKHRDHKLSGIWNKHRQCHIEPDWLLIYRITKDELILERMGSHSDLFG